MRVVAGKARGRAIAAPTGRNTRPTGDKVRQAIFNALGSLGMVEGARFADLFAGSGGLGIEALSRGAVHCTFVESDRAAARLIATNLAVLGPLTTGAAVVQPTTVEVFLARPGLDRFDVALIDPPYAFDEWPALLSAVPADLVVIESDRAIDPGRDWEIMRTRAYGGTVVVFARRDTSDGE
jgi:16S rRNA (guanine966-N2)-methyltransferase